MFGNPQTIGLKPANADKLRYVTWADLPLSCPLPGTSLWNSHQRVYLPIQESGRAQCPYCSALYVLVEPAAVNEDLAQPNVEMEYLHHRAVERVQW